MSSTGLSADKLLPPEYFVGRIHEQHEVMAYLQHNQSISLVGPPKIGKTSLMRHLMHTSASTAIDLQPVWVYVDCTELSDRTENQIFEVFSTRLRMSPDLQGDDRARPAMQESVPLARQEFDFELRSVSQLRKQIILLLDNFEALSANPHLDVQFFNGLRAAANRYPLAFVTASEQSLIQLTYTGQPDEILSSPFFNIFAPVPVGLMAEEEARESVRRFGALQRVPLSPSLEDYIYELCGGHPLFLRSACIHIRDAGNDYSAIRYRTLDELQPFLEKTWISLTDVERTVLIHLAQNESGVLDRTALDPLALRGLTQKHLLTQTRQGLRFPSVIWATYIANHIDNKPMGDSK